MRFFEVSGITDKQLNLETITTPDCVLLVHADYLFGSYLTLSLRRSGYPKRISIELTLFARHVEMRLIFPDLQLGLTFPFSPERAVRSGRLSSA